MQKTKELIVKKEFLTKIHLNSHNEIVIHQENKNFGNQYVFFPTEISEQIIEYIQELIKEARCKDE